MSKIPWTEKVWDVTGGCTQCEAGCANCWALDSVWRLSHAGQKKYQGLVKKHKKRNKLYWTNKIKLYEDWLDASLKRRKPTTYFVNSKSDLFHPSVPFEYIDKVHAVIALCPQHTFQILTKRIERAAGYYNAMYKGSRLLGERQMKIDRMVHRLMITNAFDYADGVFHPFKNLWLGTSISTQEDADKNIPILLQIPAAVRFVSLEPMLESVNLRLLEGHNISGRSSIDGRPCTRNLDTGSMIHQVIIGCESGPKARLCDIEVIRDAVRQCKDAGVPCFVKQVPVNGKCSKKPAEWPEDLRIQDYPCVT